MSNSYSIQHLLPFAHITNRFSPDAFLLQHTDKFTDLLLSLKRLPTLCSRLKS